MLRQTHLTKAEEKGGASVAAWAGRNWLTEVRLRWACTLHGSVTTSCPYCAAAAISSSTLQGINASAFIHLTSSFTTELKIKVHRPKSFG